MRRSNQLVLAGVAFFIVGVVIVLLLARDNGSSSSSSSGGTTTPVLVAKDDIAANVKGSDAADKVEVRQVPLNEKQPAALTSASQISNVRFTAPFKKGEQILTTGVQATVVSITPPEGKQAVAVRFQNVPGGAEFIQAGDHVNVYQVLPEGTNLNATDASVKLLLTNVEVLAVNKVSSSLDTQAGTTPTTAATQSRTTVGGELDFVFALDPIDAEKVIFGSSVGTNFLYLAKVGDKAPAAGATPGVGYTSILAEAPDAAAAREAAGQ